MAALLETIKKESLSKEPTVDDLDNEQYEGFLLQKIREGNVKDISDAFENPEHPVYSEMQNELKTFDSEGKSPIDLAVCLGRHEILQELHKRGASINDATETGKENFYTVFLFQINTLVLVSA